MAAALPPCSPAHVGSPLDALLTAEHVVLDGEDPALFAVLHAALVSENEPESPTDRLLVHRLAVAHWTRLRCDRFARKLIEWAPQPRYITEDGPVRGDPESHFDLRRYNALRAHQAQLGREITQLQKEIARRRAERTRGNEPEVPAAGPAPTERTGAGPSPAPRNEPGHPPLNRRERRRLKALTRRPVRATAEGRG